MRRAILAGLSIAAVTMASAATAAAAPPLILSTHEGGKLAEGTPLAWEVTELHLEATPGSVLWRLELPKKIVEIPFREEQNWEILFNKAWELPLKTEGGQSAVISPYSVGGEVIPWIGTLKSTWIGTIDGITSKLRFVFTVLEDGPACTYAARKIPLRFVVGEPGKPVALQPAALATKFALEKEHSATGCPTKMTLGASFDVKTLEKEEQVLAES